MPVKNTFGHIRSLTLHSGHGQSFPQQFAASHVENGLVTIRTLLFTPIGTFVLAVLLGALLWALAPAFMGRSFRLWEALVVAVAILVLLEWWRRRRLWREREQTESLRDSALW
jgi:hypothetical protein